MATTEPTRDFRTANRDDIPKLVKQSGDFLPMLKFYQQAYSETPAHSDDIHETIIQSPHLEVITVKGGKRNKADQIRREDILRLKSQRSFIFPP